MNNSLDKSASPPRRVRPAQDLNDTGANAGHGLLSMVSGSLKRARNSRTVMLVSRAVEAATGAAMPSRRNASLVPRPPHSGHPTGAGAPAPGPLGASGGGATTATTPTTSPQKAGGRGRAVPVSTTVVQDGVKWVNLVRFVNLARLLKPTPRSRKRVRFGASPTQRAMLMSSGGGADKAIADSVLTGAEGAPGQAAKSRPIYIQVRQGRQLVWPTFEGVDHSCFCLLLTDGQPRGSTQAVPVDSSSNINSVQWNEVFSFPRSCLQGSAGGMVRLQVWSSEAFGDDVLVGQADLQLGAMMAAERPHPLTAVLELQALDDETGQVEPGSCGELVVAAWMEPEADAAKGAPACGVSAAASADLHEAGVLTSNLSAPCGSKSVPQVVHSPLGTLYEEPCVVALKLTVLGLAELNYDLVSASAQQFGITKRRVRLEGGQRPARRDTGFTAGTSSGGAAGGMAAGGAGAHLPPPTPAASGGAAGQAQGLALASTSLARGMGAYVDRMKALPHQRSLARQLQSAAAPIPGAGGGLDASLRASSGGFGGGGNKRASITSKLKRAAAVMVPRRGSSSTKAGGAGGAGGGGGAAGDELMDEDDGPPVSMAGGTEDTRTVSADDGDDGSSLAINPTAPLTGMAAEDASAGAGQGNGVFCYFKVSVDKQSAKSRLRWLPAPSSSGPAAAATSGSLLGPLQAPPSAPPGDPLAPPAADVALQPCVFVFALPRPLANVPVGMALYATPSAKRRGRAVGRLVVSLYELLDAVLNSAAVAAAGGGPARRDMGVSGKPVEVKLPFEDEELGGVRVSVQLADLDERAMMFRLPLVSDPQQLVSEVEAGGLYGMYGGPSVVPAERVSCQGAAGGPGGAGGGHGGGVAVGPVLADTALLRSVLDRSDVDTEISHWFFRSYQRVGSLKAAGLVGPQEDRALAGLHKVFRAGLRRHGPLTATTTTTTTAGGGGGGPLVSDLTALRLDEPSATGTSLDSMLFHRDFLSTATAPSSVDGTYTTTTTTAGAAAAAGGRGSASAAAAAAAGGGGGGGGAPGVAAPPGGGGALGSLVLRISSLNSSGAIGGTSCCCIVKCGPHWLRTVDRAPAEGAGNMPQWQVVIPLYSPATILTVGIFSNSAKSVMGLTFSDSPVLVSRVRLKLSSVRPFRRSWHVITMYMNGGNGGGGGAPLVGVLGLKLQYGSAGALAASYLAAPAPESLYELELDGDTALKMEAEARKISENWLASAQPPIPPEVARLLLDDGRCTFKFPRIKTNWRRVKSGLQLLFQLQSWFKHICSWSSPRDSWEVVFCVALLCYMPSTAFKLFFIMIALRGAKGFMLFKRRIAALVEGGADSAAALLMSPAAAASAAASGGLATAAAAAAVGGGAGGGGGGGGGGVAREPVGTVGDLTIGGGVADAGSDEEEVGEDSKVPVGTVAEFKRKFAELLELGLLLQNLFDDVASILERLQAVLSFQDVVASCLFILACGLLVVVLALLGFPTTFFLALLWQVRPPSLRDALPPPPLNYFLKLPCRSAAEFG